MGNILAINQAAKEAIERQEIEIMKDEFRAFVKESPEVKVMLLERAAKAISELSAWEIAYHGGFKEEIGLILKQPQVQEVLQEATKRVLTDGGDNVNYLITQALGEYLAGRITMKLEDK